MTKRDLKRLIGKQVTLHQALCIAFRAGEEHMQSCHKDVWEQHVWITEVLEYLYPRIIIDDRKEPCAKIS
jgi:hypothetical protein